MVSLRDKQSWTDLDCSQKDPVVMCSNAFSSGDENVRGSPQFICSKIQNKSNFWIKEEEGIRAVLDEKATKYMFSSFFLITSKKRKNIRQH